MYPTQIDGIRWFEAVGQWIEQTDLIWLDFAGKNLGELNLWMLGDELFDDASIQRAVGQESYASTSYFGNCMSPYWESKLFDEQDAQKLVTSVKQLIEYEGAGRLCILLPNEDNQYEQVVETELALRDYPSLAVFNAGKVGKGTGIAICLQLDCALEPVPVDPEFPDYDYSYDYNEPPPPPPEETEWEGFQFFTDVHSCTPQGDAQQYAFTWIACFVFCDEPICGGVGGWLAWYSSNEDHLAQRCDHPDNPIPGWRGL